MIRARNGRLIVPERLDQAPDDEARVNLNELVFINRWFGGHRVLRQSLRRLYSTNDVFTMLDIGAATGDVARTVTRAFPSARVTSLDWKARNLRDAPHPKVTGDAFALPFRDQSFDIVHCALFLHHFSDAQVVELLSNMRRCARHAVVIQDLERHPLAYYFLPSTSWLLRWSPIVLHDGPVSVEAAFHAHELQSLAYQAGLVDGNVQRHRPWFRLSLVSKLNPPQT